MTQLIARPLIVPATPAEAFLPEGPRNVTVGGRAALAWVNIQNGPTAKVGAVQLRYWDSGDRRTLPQPGRPGFLLPTNRSHVVLVGMDRTLGLLDLVSNQFESLVELPAVHPRAMINDGEIVPGGAAIVFGTKDAAFRDPVAALYLWTLIDNRISVLADEQTCSNGKVLRRRDTGLYLFDIDTPKKKIVRYKLDVDARTIERGTTAISLTDRDDFPDGMVGCGDGSAIVAFYQPARGGDGEAVRYDLTSGAVLTKWTVPGSPRVTCPCLVDRPGGVKVIFTTAVEGMNAKIRSTSPNAGALFLADIGENPLRRAPQKRPIRVRAPMEIVKFP